MLRISWKPLPVVRTVLLALFCFSCAATSGAPQSATPEVDTTNGSAGSPPPTPAVSATDRPEQALAKVPVSAADPQWGDVDAPVTLVEISDFQCPFCQRVQPTLERLKQKYGPSRLRVVWKHNPLPFHREARPAHDTAAAVFMLAGSRAFFAFRDLAFANQRALTAANLEAWAAQAGVQPPALRAWLDSGRAAQKVQTDMDLARNIGAPGTPAFRINGVTIAGAQPFERFVEVIDDQLTAAEALVAAGTPRRLVYATLTDKNVEIPAPRAPRAPSDEEEDTRVWNVPILADDPVRGPQDALVSVIVFSEFQCPFCKRVEETLGELRKHYDKDLRIVWKDNPLPFHGRAKPAAIFARYVYQKKGNDAFWSAHDDLFASAPQLEESDLQKLAQKLGLAWAPIGSLLASNKVNPKIEDSISVAADFQARGTPHFFINGRRFSGAQPLDAFKQLIDAELAKAQALVDKGTPRAKVFAELMKTAENPAPPEKKHIELRADAASRGNAKAPVVIQIFSDFQCPFCKRVEPTLAELDKEHPGSIRVVWRHLPLPFHPQAALAAEASEEVLAQKGGVAFWRFHDDLFDVQGIDGGLKRDSLTRLAEKQGVDVARFQEALDSGKHRAKVEADAEAASRAGINGTPAFVINDYYLSGAQPIAAFRKLVRLAQKDPRKP